MKLVDLVCPNCGGSVQFSEDKKIITCQYCKHELHFQEELDRIQSNNAVGIKEYAGRAYDLLRQGKFVQAESVANEGLKAFPYAGRLHLALLMAELNITNPSQLATYGKDYTTSDNYKSCLLYMTTEDKNDLLTLVEQNKSATPQTVGIKGTYNVVDNTPKDQTTTALSNATDNKMMREPIAAKEENKVERENKISSVQNTNTNHNNKGDNKMAKEGKKGKTAIAKLMRLLGIIAIPVGIVFIIIGASIVMEKEAGAIAMFIIGALFTGAGAVLFIIGREWMRGYCEKCGAKMAGCEYEYELKSADRHYNDVKNEYWIKYVYAIHAVCPSCGHFKDFEFKLNLPEKDNPDLQVRQYCRARFKH